MSPMDIRVFLVGFMGAGKTSLGRLLAERTGWVFHDLDETIETDAGSSIARLFAEKEEAHFRRLEARALARLADLPGPAVIACGGGAFCAPGNRAVMQSRGITVWVDQPFDAIWRRRGELSSTRPLLGSETGARALYEERAHAYALAAIHLPVAEESLDLAVEDLLRQLRYHAPIP